MKPARRTFCLSLVMAAFLGAASACSEQDSGDRDGATPPSPAPAPDAAPPPTPPPPAQAQPPATPPAPGGAAAPTAAADGKTVYTTYCVTCHGPTGKGDGPGAPPDPKPRDFTAGEFKFDPNKDGKPGETEDLVEVVKNGAAAYGGSPLMIPWKTALNDQQVQAVVEYVQSLKGGS